MISGIAEGVFSDFYGIALALLVNREVQLTAYHFQLLDGGGAVHLSLIHI